MLPAFVLLQGCGRQRAGALVNAVAFYFAAVPLALLLAFRQGLGPQGLYLGMAVGPAIQTVRVGVSGCTTKTSSSQLHAVIGAPKPPMPLSACCGCRPFVLTGSLLRTLRVLTAGFLSPPARPPGVSYRVA